MHWYLTYWHKLLLKLIITCYSTSFSINCRKLVQCGIHCSNGFSTFQDIIHELLNKDADRVPEEAPLIVLDIKSAMCMAKDGNYIRNTSNIARRIHFVSNGEKCKMHKIDWCEGVLKLSDIATNNVGDNYLTPIMKYIMVSLDNWDRTLIR